MSSAVTPTNPLPPRGGLAVLVVDDSATTRAMVSRIVRMVAPEGVTVAQAADGAEALKVVSSGGIGLVLADLNMPNMNGEELIHRMHADPATRGIPVVVVSALPDPDRIDRLCGGGGASGYLAKPFTPEAARDIIKPLLERSANTGGTHVAA